MARPTVNTEYGKIEGVCLRNIDGQGFYGFKGIPYAKPPIGNLRFSDPQPPTPWQGILKAENFGPRACQLDEITKIIVGEDDCLYLNIYTKTTDKNARQPVMVWIHGGAFILGEGDDLFYGPNFLLKKDVVFVTINYRLGILGFLNLQDKAAPGNQGFKDQVLALTWIKQNIINFGGDSNNITIFGESAGSASVHYLCLSPLTKGLFHKAIMQSGVCTNQWASVPNPLEYAYRICEFFGRKLTDPRQIVEFLRTIDAKKLIDGQVKIMKEAEKLRNYVSGFGPGVDDKSDRPFMPVPADIAAQNGIDIPVIIGNTNREGIIILMEAHPELFERLESNFDQCFHPNILRTLEKYDLRPIDIKNMYFGKGKITKEDNVDNYIDMSTDLQFRLNIHEVIKIQVEKSPSPTYMYEFTYEKGISLIKKMLDSPNIKGACHFDECPYQFNSTVYEGLGVEPFKKGSEMYRLMEQMTELWYNFAQTGRPTPTISEILPTYWQPVADTKTFRHLIIGEDLRMGFTVNLQEQYSYKKHMRNKL